LKLFSNEIEFENKESASKALYKYGTGTCGPRGFYGTIGTLFIKHQVYSLKIFTWNWRAESRTL
jgi:hypothetical protein